MSNILPTPTNPPLPLQSYAILSFDVYGTLIEYKSHILNSFQPLLSRLPSSSPYLNTTPSSTEIPGSATQGSIEFLKLFQRHEDAIKLERKPRRFDELLRELWRRIASDLAVSTTEEETHDFGNDDTIAKWPTFPGTVQALQTLSKRYKLVALSNIDRYAWSLTSSSSTSGLGEVNWTKVFTAEDFPPASEADADEAKLKALLDYAESELRIPREKCLHVAQSLGHDQAPAKRLGISSVWIVGDGPKWGKGDEAKKALDGGLVGFAWKFDNLAEFADKVERGI